METHEGPLPVHLRWSSVSVLRVHHDQEPRDPWTEPRLQLGSPHPDQGVSEAGALRWRAKVLLEAGLGGCHGGLHVCETPPRVVTTWHTSCKVDFDLRLDCGRQDELNGGIFQNNELIFFIYFFGHNSVRGSKLKSLYLFYAIYLFICHVYTAAFCVLSTPAIYKTLFFMKMFQYC